MILKSSILVIAMVSGVFASENPFAIEKNIQKIEKEESALLQALSNEKSALRSDDISEQSVSPQGTGKKETTSPAISQNELEVNVSSLTEKTTQTAEGTPVASEKVDVEAEVAQPQAVEAVKTTEENISFSKELPILAEENQSKPQSIESAKSDAKAVVVPPVAPAVQTQDVKKEVLAVESAKKEMADKPSAISDDKKKEALQTIESQVEKIDAKIAELESKLKKSRESVMSGDKNEEGGTPLAEEVKPESAKAVEPARDSAFEKELQEAIQSVQN